MHQKLHPEKNVPTKLRAHNLEQYSDKLSIRGYVEAIEYKKETKLTLAQLEKAWAKMKRSKRDEKRVAKENRVSIDTLKRSKIAINEAQKRIKQIVKELGIPTAILKTGAIWIWCL